MSNYYGSKVPISRGRRGVQTGYPSQRPDAGSPALVEPGPLSALAIGGVVPTPLANLNPDLEPEAVVPPRASTAPRLSPRLSPRRETQAPRLSPARGSAAAAQLAAAPARGPGSPPKLRITPSPRTQAAQVQRPGRAELGRLSPRSPEQMRRLRTAGLSRGQPGVAKSEWEYLFPGLLGRFI